MSRLVEHDATGPKFVDESDIDTEKGDIAICQCGLSAEYPFCDGTHRETESEDADTVYRYLENADGDVNRKEIRQITFADGTVASGTDGGQ